MQLTQSGSTVTGTYVYDQGEITGTVTGNVLRGTWTEVPTRQPPDDAGDFEFTMDEECESFSGTWGYGSGGGMTGDWSGTRTSSGP